MTASFGAVDLVASLIRARADVNEENGRGFTLLIEVVRGNHINYRDTVIIARQLLVTGADVNPRPHGPYEKGAGDKWE